MNLFSEIAEFTIENNNNNNYIYIAPLKTKFTKCSTESQGKANRMVRYKYKNLKNKIKIKNRLTKLGEPNICMKGRHHLKAVL